MKLLTYLSQKLQQVVTIQISASLFQVSRLVLILT